MTLVVTLTVRRAELDGFRTFERHAARVMARYGGAIERTVVVDDAPTSPLFRDVHLVTFPSASAFDAYRADAELASWQALREASVVETVVLVGVDGPTC